MDTLVEISIIGSINTTIRIKLTDTVSSILSLLNIENGKILYNGQILSPAFSLMFYGIKDGSQLILANQDESSNLLKIQSSFSLPNFEIKKHSFHRNYSYSNLLTNQDSKRVKTFFDEKCIGKIKDPEIILQRFQYATNPMTSSEYARVSDIYRSRIESNARSFRRLCKKYRNFIELEKPNDMIIPTILPEKAEEPSTKLLPVNYFS